MHHTLGIISFKSLGCPGLHGVYHHLDLTLSRNKEQVHQVFVSPNNMTCDSETFYLQQWNSLHHGKAKDYFPTRLQKEQAEKKTGIASLCLLLTFPLTSLDAAPSYFVMGVKVEPISPQPPEAWPQTSKREL